MIGRAHISFVAALIACVALLLIPVCIRLFVASRTFENVQDVPHTEAAIVLGASVRHGEPSPTLAKRADAAIALYKAGKVDKILITGDDGTNEYDEVTPTRKYVLDHGVPPEDVFLDHAGFDTYSSMYRAIHVFRAESMTIVTQEFHMPRALFIARSLHADAYGLVAEGGEYSLRNYLREIPASYKALLDVLLKRQPRYLGKSFPLTGTGTTTWY